MSLNWNIEKCKDFETLNGDVNKAIIETIIMATMFVGINAITEANAKEFYARLHLIERLSGTFTNQNGKPRYITLENVERLIGLRTNASHLSRPQFLKAKMTKYFNEIVKA